MNYFHFVRNLSFLLTNVLFILPFLGASNIVSVNRLSPTSPARLNFGEEVTISFSYNITEPGGARIFIRPITGTTTTSNYAASGSSQYKGQGNATATFTITEGNTQVDKLRVQVYNSTQSRLLFEFYFPVSYTFAPNLPVLTLSKQAINPALQQSVQEMQTIQQNKVEDDSNEQPQSQPVTRKILPDGSVETTYPDGRVVKRFKGGFEIYNPETGQSQTALFSTGARPSVPPSLPEGAEMAWMEAHSENLLGIIKSLVNNDSASIDNYLQYEGDQNIYNRIVTREETINYMVQP
jgi:hypothetical protein